MTEYYSAKDLYPNKMVHAAVDHVLDRNLVN